jgi:NADPH-dependent F420 reductase
MGRSLAVQLGKTGERVVLADWDPDTARTVVAEIDAGDGLRAAGIGDALAADIVVLALWHPRTLVFASEHVAALRGKIVVDVSNPIDESWVRLTTHPTTSSAELLAAALPESRVIKAFNTTTSPVLADGQLDGIVLDVFVAGDDDDAKAQVGDLVRAAGLRSVDAGRLDNARLLERLTAFQIELSQLYGLDGRLTLKMLPTELVT